MVKAMPYSLYKRSYSQFDAVSYDARKKTVQVELPDYKAPAFPKEWGWSGREWPKALRTESYSILVRSYNSGLAESYVIEYAWQPGRMGFERHGRKEIGPGLFSRRDLIAEVQALTSKLA